MMLIDTYLIRNTQDLYEEDFPEKHQRTSWTGRTGSCVERMDV